MNSLPTLARETGLEPATSAVTGRRSSSKNNARFDSGTGKTGSKACDSTPESKRIRTGSARLRWALDVLRATRKGTFREAISEQSKALSKTPEARERQRHFGMASLRARQERRRGQ